MMVLIFDDDNEISGAVQLVGPACFVNRKASAYFFSRFSMATKKNFTQQQNINKCLITKRKIIENPCFRV
jgi:hypothetical protein